MSIKLRQLEYFTRVLEVGNITRAADQLHVAQTALGIQIRNLEEEMRVPLLERHSRGVSPTRAGEILYRHATGILSRVDQAIVEVRTAGSAVREPLVIGVTPSIIRLIGPGLLVRQKTSADGVQLQLTKALSAALVDMVERDEVHYALAYDVAPRSSLLREPVLEEQLLYIVPGGSGDGGKPISFPDAIRSSLALSSDRDVTWQIVYKQAKRLGLEVNAAYEVQSTGAIKSLVEKGVASSIMPYGDVAEELHSGALVSRPIEGPTLLRTLFVISSSHRAAGPYASEFAALKPVLIEDLAAAIGSYCRRITV